MSRFLPTLALTVATALMSSSSLAGNVSAEGWIDPTFAADSSTPGWRRVFSSGTVDERGLAVGKVADGGYITLISVPGGTAGSRIGLQRLTRDGALVSANFGISGKVLKDAGMITVSDMLIDQAGRIVVVGSAPGVSGAADFAVVRFLPDGSDDLSFGVGGKVVKGFDFTTVTTDTALTILEQPVSGGTRYVIGGNTAPVNSAFIAQIGLMGLRMDGSLDPDFGNLVDYDGMGTSAFNNSDAAYLGDMMLAAGNRIVTVGTRVFGEFDTDTAACVLSVNGLGVSGSVNCYVRPIDIPGPGNSVYDSANAVTLDGAGRAVVAGVASGRAIAYRLLISTSPMKLELDTTFIGGGTPARPSTYVSESLGSSVNDVVVRPQDGTILLAGFQSSNRTGLVQRLNTNGSPTPGGAANYIAPTLGASSSYQTEFRRILLDRARPVLFGTSPDSTTDVTDLDGILTRLQTTLAVTGVFSDGFE